MGNEICTKHNDPNHVHGLHKHQHNLLDVKLGEEKKYVFNKKKNNKAFHFLLLPVQPNKQNITIIT